MKAEVTIVLPIHVTLENQGYRFEPFVKCCKSIGEHTEKGRVKIYAIDVVSDYDLLLGR